MKKILSYLLVYICSVALTATGVVFVNRLVNPSTELPPNSQEIVVTEPSAMEKVIEQVSTLSSFKVTADFALQITEGKENLDIFADLDVNFDISKLLSGDLINLEKPSLQGLIALKFRGESYSFNLKYLDGTIYLSAYSYDFYLQTSELSELVEEVKTLLGVKSTPAQSKELDTSKLMQYLNKLEETKTENEVILTLPIGETSDIVITLDKEYNIQNVKIPEISLSKVKLLGEISLTKYPTKVEISPLDKAKSKNLGEIKALMEILNNTVDSQYLDFDARLSVEEYFANLNFKVDLNDGFKMQASIINTLANCLVDVRDKDILLKYNDLALQMGADDFSSVQKLLQNPIFSSSDKVDLSSILPKEFEVALANVKTLPLLLTPQNIFKTLFEADLSKDNFKLNFADTLKLDLAFSKEKIKNLNFDLGNASVKLYMNSGKSTFAKVNKSEFIPLSSILEKVNFVINSLSCKNFTVEGALSLAQKDIAFKLLSDLSSSPKLQLNALQSEITFVDGKLFVEAFGKNYEFSKENFESLKEAIGSLKLFEESDNSIFEKILGTTLPVRSLSALNLDIFSSISLDENKLSLALNGLGKIQITFEDNLVKTLSLNNEKAQVDCNLSYVKVEIERPSKSFESADNLVSLATSFLHDIDNTLSINNVATLANNVANTLKKGVFLSLDGKISDLTFGGKLMFDSSLKASIHGNPLNKPLAFELHDDFAFVDFDGLKLSLDLNDLDKFKTILNEYFGLNLDDFSIESIKNKLTYEKLSEIFGKLKINLTENLIEVCFDDKVKISVNLSSLKFDDINIQYLDKLSLSAKFEEEMELNPTISDGILLNDLADVLSATLKTVSDKKISGDVALSFLAFEEQNNLNLKYGIDFSNSVNSYVSTTFKGVELKGFGLKEQALLDIAGMKLSLPYDYFPTLIDFLKNSFGLDLGQGISLENISFDIIDSVRTEDGICVVALKKGGTLTVLFDDVISEVSLESDKLSIQLDITSFDDVIVDKGEISQYTHISVLQNLVGDVLQTLKPKAFDITANANVFNESGLRFLANGQLQLDLNNALSLFGHVLVDGESKHEITASYLNEMVYADYLGLKLKMNINSLGEVAVLVLNAFGVDTSNIPFLDEISSDMELTAGNLQEFFPQIDTGNPLNFLEMLKGLSLSENKLSISIFNEKLSPNASGDMEILLLASENCLKNMSIQNAYTGVTAKERFDLDLNFNPFEKVTQPQDMDAYIDLSDATSIIKGAINTSELNDYKLSMTAKIKMKVIGIDIDVNVPIDIKIKLDENKRPTIEAVIGEIPVIVGVNNDVPYVGGDTNGGGSRFLNLYYQDEMVYIHRTEQISRFLASSQKYEKKLLLHTSELFSDPLFYLLEYGVGMSDSIMGAINDAISSSSNRTEPIDPSKVLLGYSFDKNEKSHSIVLNMRELTNNPDLDKATIKIFTVNSDSTGNKDYLGKATFDLNLPLSSAFSLNIQTNDLTLDNIGQPVDISKSSSYISSYPYGEDMSYSGRNDSLNLDFVKNRTISFETNCEQKFDSIIQNASSAISLPNLSDRIVDDGQTRKICSFVGWYESSAFEGEQFLSEKMPRKDMTLYAKWELLSEKKYSTFTLYKMNGEEPFTQRILEGESLPTFPPLQNFVTDDNVTRISYAFVDYFTTINFQEGTNYLGGEMGQADITVYAKWDEVTEFYRQITISDELFAENKQIIRQLENSELHLPTYEDKKVIDKNITRTYAFKGYFDENDNLIDIQIMPTYDLSLHAKWQLIAEERTQTLTIMYHGEQIFRDSFKVGEQIVLPNIQNIDENTLFYIDFQFTSQISLTEMGEEDITCHARNLFTISFENSPYGFVNADITAYEGEQISLPILSKETFDDKSTKKITYDFLGFLKANGETFSANVMPSENLLLRENWHVVEKNYYTVSFNTNFETWTGKDVTASAVAPVIVLEGETLQVPTSTYYSFYNYKFGFTYRYKIKSWQLNGQDVSSIVVNGNITLTGRYGT